jgi:hypothetical protein
MLRSVIIDRLRLNAAATATVGKELASGDTYNRIAAITADLRARYPTVERGELVNYLVTAYCPTVAARTNLNDSQKQATVETFASEVMQQVY